MIRKQTRDGWILIRHQDHARLAGAFAEHWGNSRFPRPEPFAHILVGVARHDDAWAARDSSPELAPDGRPAAFSSELVGAYSAFENIDLEAYLRVRGEATEAVAGENPYGAILISMHTVNLLTEQADLETLDAAGRSLHGEFISGQLNRQKELKASLESEGFEGAFLENSVFQRGFEFLQACDSLSLMVCSAYPSALPLRHQHPDSNGNLETLTYTPVGEATFQVAPWPFAEPGPNQFRIPIRRLSGDTYPDQEALLDAWNAGTPDELAFALIPDA